jgi:hypothetical protein
MKDVSNSLQISNRELDVCNGLYTIGYMSQNDFWKNPNEIFVLLRT